MLRLVAEHRDTSKDLITNSILNGPSLSKLDMHQMSQVKGQVLAFEEILKTKEFLEELLEENQPYERDQSNWAENLG